MRPSRRLLLALAPVLALTVALTLGQAPPALAAEPSASDANSAEPPAASPTAGEVGLGPDGRPRSLVELFEDTGYIFSSLDTASPESGPGASPEALPEPERGRAAEISAAVARYRSTGDAAILKRSGVTLFPFDESQPVVRCSPLRACDIELQPGETVTGVALGAPELWSATKLVTGDPAEPTPHVIITARDYDLATNIVIGTTRRTYHVGLVSPPRERVEAGVLAYHRHVAFYYPAEAVERWADMERLREDARERRRAAAVSEMGRLAVADLNFDYDLKADKRATWSPTLVFDDGRQVYIRLPARVVAGDLPTLLVSTGDGELAVGNFRVHGTWMVYDGLFARAELALGVGKKRRRVELVNRSWPS